MVATLIAIALLASPAFAQDYTKNMCWHNGQFVPERTQIDRGRYWYECVRGKQEPRGCFDENRRRIRLHESYVSPSGFEMTCQLDQQGYLTLPITACSMNGQRHPPGDTWQDYRGGKFWYTCKKVDSYNLMVEVSGCVSASGQRLRIGDKIDVGDTWYECQRKANGSVALCCRGCIHDGRRYEVGASWPDGDFIYYCKIENGKCKKICVGCQTPFGEKLTDGDRYFQDEAIIQCEVRPDDHAHRIVGCVQKDRYGNTIERVIGCRWYESDGVEKWEMTCKKREGKAVKENLGCVFVEQGAERLIVEPGSYTIYFSEEDQKNVGLACRETYNGRYSLEKMDIKDIPYRASGMPYSAPRGKK